jgi:two-component system, sensor histidine kinase and response regulator
MNDHITKPIDGRVLVKLVERYGYDPDGEADAPEDGALGAIAPLAPGTTTRICDLQATLRRCGGDEQLVREMTGFFLEDAPRLLADIEAGLAGDDLDLARRAAHSLKGLASNFDAEPVISAALTLEAAAESGENALADKARVPLVEETDHLIAALSEALGDK